MLCQTILVQLLPALSCSSLERSLLKPLAQEFQSQAVVYKPNLSQPVCCKNDPEACVTFEFLLCIISHASYKDYLELGSVALITKYPNLHVAPTDHLFHCLANPLPAPAITPRELPKKQL